MEKLFKTLMIAQGKYEGVIGGVEAKLADKIEFEFSIFWQPSDGFVILDVEGNNNAPFSKCLNIIIEKGKLSHDDYMRENGFVFKIWDSIYFVNKIIIINNLW